VATLTFDGFFNFLSALFFVLLPANVAFPEKIFTRHLGHCKYFLFNHEALL
jgi:hypothetical protein